MGILENIINSIKGLVSSVKGAFNNDPRYAQYFDWYPGSGGGGGDVTKAYVDEKDGLLSDRIDGLNTTKADKATTYTKTETDDLLDDKVDKLTDEGEFVYSHDGTTQNSKAFIAGDTLLNSSAHVPSAHTVKKYVDDADENKLDKLTDEGEFVYSHDGAVQTSKGFEVSDEPSGSAAHVTSSKTLKAVKTALDNAKADKATTLAGYGITNAYTKAETNDLLDDKVDKINITAQSTQGLYPVTINTQGQVASYGTKQTPSDTYNSTGDNQLLTRKGAYNLWNDITAGKDKGWTNIISGIQYCCKNRVVCIRIAGNISADANGIIANVPSGYRPTAETAYCYGVDFGAVMDKGGWIATNGEMRVHQYSVTLNQMRMFISYTI